jgi:hypothetical protein
MAQFILRNARGYTDGVAAQVKVLHAQVAVLQQEAAQDEAQHQQEAAQEDRANARRKACIEGSSLVFGTVISVLVVVLGLGVAGAVLAFIPSAATITLERIWQL